VLACFSLASGPYVAVAVAAALGLKLFRPEHRSRWTWITIVLCAFIVVANLPFVVRGPTGNSGYRAKSLQSFVSALLRQASWPNVDYHLMWLAFLIFLPIGWLIFAILRTREDLPASVYAVVALGIWNALLLTSLAFARADLVPYVRYYDYYAFNLIVSALALIEIIRLRLYPDLFGAIVVALSTFIVAAYILGAFNLLSVTLNYWLPGRVNELRAQQQAVRAYYKTGNLDILKGADLHGTYPFNETWYRSLGSTLTKPEVRSVLPANLRPELDGQKPDEGVLTKLRRALLQRVDRNLRFTTIVALLLVTAWGLSLVPVRLIVYELMTWHGPADRQ
jgi:hypothetical protein